MQNDSSGMTKYFDSIEKSIAKAQTQERNSMKEPKRVKWGVIGSGGIAQRRTIPEGIAAATNAELVAVYGTNSASNAQVAKNFGVQAVNSISDLLACDVDAVYVATPPQGHCEQTAACARAGKHVLCEKPLARTVAEVETMIQICTESNVRLGTALMMRFQAQHRVALDYIQNGSLGKPVFGRAQLSCWYPPMTGAWRQDVAIGGGGSLMDMGGHCIDLLEMFFGKPKAVSCRINRTVHDYTAEDSAVVMIFFENGAIGVVDTFFCIPDECSRNVLELYGSNGCILASGTIGQGDLGEMVVHFKNGSAGYDAKQERSADGGFLVKPAPVNMYRAEVEEFSQAIIDGREPYLSALIGLQSQRILAACYQSAQTGKTVEL